VVTEKTGTSQENTRINLPQRFLQLSLGGLCVEKRFRGAADEHKMSLAPRLQFGETFDRQLGGLERWLRPRGRDSVFLCPA
jgi:hypothetical protein